MELERILKSRAFWIPLGAALTFSGTTWWLGREGTPEAIATTIGGAVALTWAVCHYVAVMFSRIDRADQTVQVAAPRSPGPKVCTEQMIKQRLRILFVDDQQPTAVELLSAAGFNVRLVSDLTALEVRDLGKLDYHLVFLDIAGVGAEFTDEGVGVLREIKRHGALPFVAVYSSIDFNAGDDESETIHLLSDYRAKKQFPESFEAIALAAGRRFFSAEGLAADLAHFSSMSVDAWLAKLRADPDGIEPELLQALTGADGTRRVALVEHFRLLRCSADGLN